jgi:hypothetical protein
MFSHRDKYCVILVNMKNTAGLAGFSLVYKS